MAISYTYERITLDIADVIQVVAFTMDSTQPGKQIIVDHTFAAGTSGSTIDTEIATAAALVWSLQV